MSDDLFIALWWMTLVIAVGFWLWWQHHDNKRNWRTVALKNGFFYQEHVRLRKRRVTRDVGGRPNADWLNFKTDKP